MKTSAMRFPGSRSPNEIDIAVGIKLRKLRLEAGMTLQDLADQIGTSHQQLQKYETGVNRLSVGMLPIVADALSVEIMEFFADAKLSATRRQSAAEKIRAESESLLRRTKSDTVLRSMLRVLKALSAQ